MKYRVVKRGPKYVVQAERKYTCDDGSYWVDCCHFDDKKSACSKADELKLKNELGKEEVVYEA